MIVNGPAELWWGGVFNGFVKIDFSRSPNELVVFFEAAELVG
jgi:hypothetical protein